jgi:hydrogenase nickel incorporation protein HypB
MSSTVEPRVIEVHEAVLGKNDVLAARNRERFLELGILAINIMSSPGSGKTALLERTLTDLAATMPMAVIVGDVATANDAVRLGGKGGHVVQIMTHGYCHLDADMVSRALEAVPLEDLRLLFIENVGNLVCPASFDLGEARRVALLSVTEGEDKPLKYPTLFSTAHAVIINKMDLAEVVGFDGDAARASIRAVAPDAAIFELSARTGAGMELWYDFLKT